MVDQPALALGHARGQRLGDHAIEVGRVGFDCRGQRPAAQRAEAHAAERDGFAREQRHALVVAHQQAAVACQRRPLGREVEGDDVEVLAGDVAPHVLLGPIGEREDACRLAWPQPAVEQAPHLWPLPARVPAVAFRAEREHALLGARRLLVAPRAAKSGIEDMLVQRLPQPLRLHHVGVEGRRIIDRVDAARDALPG